MIATSGLGHGLVRWAADAPGNDDTPGLMAFLVVAVLLVVCVFLYRSLRKHLGRVDFEEQRPAAARPTSHSAGSEPS
jgi:hypothetical protein